MVDFENARTSSGSLPREHVRDLYAEGSWDVFNRLVEKHDSPEMEEVETRPLLFAFLKPEIIVSCFWRDEDLDREWEQEGRKEKLMRFFLLSKQPHNGHGVHRFLGDGKAVEEFPVSFIRPWRYSLRARRINCYLLVSRSRRTLPLTLERFSNRNSSRSEFERVRCSRLPLVYLSAPTVLPFPRSTAPSLSSFFSLANLPDAFLPLEEPHSTRHYSRHCLQSSPHQCFVPPVLPPIHVPWEEL